MTMYNAIMKRVKSKELVEFIGASAPYTAGKPEFLKSRDEFLDWASEFSNSEISRLEKHTNYFGEKYWGVELAEDL